MKCSRISQIRLCAILGGLSGLTCCLVFGGSINVLVFDWLTNCRVRKVFNGWFMLP